MRDALIIFNVHKNVHIKTISFLLTDYNTIRGRDFLIVLASPSILCKIQEENDLQKKLQKAYDMCMLKDLHRPSEKPIVLELIKYEPCDNELFFLRDENTSYIYLNDFVGNLAKKAEFKGDIAISNTGKFVVHNFCLYSGSEWKLYAVLPPGMVLFSHDDSYLSVSLEGNTKRIYNTTTMQFNEYENVSKVAFGIKVVLLDDSIVELEKDAANLYKNLLCGYTSEMSDEYKQERSTDDDEKSQEIETACERKDMASPDAQATPSEINSNESDSDFLEDNWLDSDVDDTIADCQSFIIPEYKQVYFSPYDRSLVVLGSQLYFDNGHKVIVRKQLSDKVNIYWTRKRCYAQIVKRTGDREKAFIESYADFITVNEVEKIKDAAFDDECFIIDDGSLRYYELKNKMFVLVNTISNADKFCLYGHIYAVGYVDRVEFYNKKKLIAEHMVMVEQMEFSKSGLFVAVIGSNQVNMFDCNGALIYTRAFNGIRNFQFLNFVRIDKQLKDEIKANYEESIRILGDKQDINIECFKRRTMSFETKKKMWIDFLKSLG